MARPPAYLHFDGMAWPHPDDPQEVEWSLRYGTPDARQRMIAASMVAAYRHLVTNSGRTRNALIAALRKAMKEVDDG